MIKLTRIDAGLTKALFRRAPGQQIRTQISQVYTIIKPTLHENSRLIVRSRPRNNIFGTTSMNMPVIFPCMLQRRRCATTVSQAAPSVIISGGGAAGLTAAYFAALQGAEVSMPYG